MTTAIERDGPVTTIVRARNEARNAMDPASAEALVEALLAFDRDPSQSAAVLWGAGGAFCAGFDLKYAASKVGNRQPLSDLDFPEVREVDLYVYFAGNHDEVRALLRRGRQG